MAYGLEAEALKLVPKMDGIATEKLNWAAIMTWVDTYIDGHLRGYYVVPFTTAGGPPTYASEPTIKSLAETLYAGVACALRYSEDDPSRIEDEFWWKQGVNMLKRIRASKISLDLTKCAKETRTDWVRTRWATFARPVFNMGTELDIEPDPLVNPDIDSPDYHRRINPEDVVNPDIV